MTREALVEHVTRALAEVGRNLLCRQPLGHHGGCR